MDILYWISWAWILDSFLRGYVLFLAPVVGLVYILLNRYWKPKTPWWIGIGIILLSLVYPHFDHANRGYVEHATSTYIIVRYDQIRYYMEQSSPSYLEIGDQFVCDDNPSFESLKMTTVEGGFDFAAYLKVRMVHQSLSCTFQVVHQTWFRLHSWKRSLLQQWPESYRTFLGHLMFQEDYERSSLSILSFFSISGLGWWTVLWFVDKATKPWLKVRHQKVLLTIFLLPYSMIMITSFSIVRVSGFYLLSLWSPPMLQRWLKRWGVLLYFVLFPFSYLQQGFHLYVVFKLYYATIHPWLSLQRIPIRISVYTSFLYGIQALFFHHIQWFQPLLYPLWLMVFPPLWLWITLVWGLPIFHPGITIILTSLQPLLSFASTQLPRYDVVPLSIGITVLVLALSIVLLYGLKRSLSSLVRYSIIVSTSLLMVSQLPIQRWLHPFRIHFINVGQGDATLMEIGSYRILIDTGGSFYRDIAQEVLMPYFSRLFIYRLHDVIITHDDYDHGGALESLSQHIRIDRIHQFSFHSLKGPTWRLVNLNVWQEEAQEDNDASLILLFEYATCSVLIMGDAPVKYEEKLVGLSMIASLDVLRIGHHGSLTSTSETFLNWTQPQVAIISVGGGNRYGHPHPIVIERLSQRNILSYRTDIQGTIVMNSCKITV